MEEAKTREGRSTDHTGMERPMQKIQKKTEGQTSTRCGQVFTSAEGRFTGEERQPELRTSGSKLLLPSLQDPSSKQGSERQGVTETGWYQDPRVPRAGLKAYSQVELDCGSWRQDLLSYTTASRRKDSAWYEQVPNKYLLNDKMKKKKAKGKPRHSDWVNTGLGRQAGIV